MIWPTALPVAALRVLRTAVGRRVLQLALLVAGLFALGFLCGEQAQAAEGVPTPIAVTTRVESPAAAEAPAAAAAVVPDKVVRPAGEAVAAVSEELGRTPAPPVSSSPRLPSLPVVSDLSDLHDLPGLSELSGIPGIPALPGLPALAVRTLPAPVVQAPAPDSAVSPSSDGRAAGDRATAEGAVSYGPVGSVTGGSDGVDHRVAPAHTGHLPLPVRHGPAGDRNGVLGGGSVLDGGASRHADAHAVTPYQRVPLRLAPDSAVRSDAAETRDRFRDIPVFPG
ncbi:hypothetical protein [Streptomyces sp. 3214.6]|uniref:hypothetical protein n=1 Tax=Streptomyces sp. 3214.6 TaxID=1882757 RepID=UPI00090B18C4|nr:hypothetical protein [Streptomyces sp. 3214.6]SHI04490.1 hypothetical protein SAMN05444521_3466 [Streptomyces sp. 3214.6]